VPVHFLVVDDSNLDRHFLVSLLESLGHQVDACENSIGLVEKVQAGGYHSVFLDIVMPGQDDGYKLLRKLRANPMTAHQHIIFYSSKSTPLEVSYGMKRAGADDYLTKPVTLEQLAAALQKV
jgi:twitching motility two-component system response regulator PilH